MEDEPNAFAESRTRESDVPIGIIPIGRVYGPVGVMVGVRVVLLEEIDSLFSGFPVVVGGPGEVLVRGICRNAEEVVPLHQSSREGMDGDGLEIGRRGDELEDVIDIVLLDVRGIHFRCGVDRVVFHSRGGVLIRSETSWGRDIVVANMDRWDGGENHKPVFFHLPRNARDPATTPCHETFIIKTAARLDSGEAVCSSTPSAHIFGPGTPSSIISVGFKADPTRLS